MGKREEKPGRITVKSLQAFFSDGWTYDSVSDSGAIEAAQKITEELEKFSDSIHENTAASLAHIVFDFMKSMDLTIEIRNGVIGIMVCPSDGLLADYLDTWSLDENWPLFKPLKEIIDNSSNDYDNEEFCNIVDDYNERIRKFINNYEGE